MYVSTNYRPMMNKLLNTEYEKQKSSNGSGASEAHIRIYRRTMRQYYGNHLGGGVFRVAKTF